METFRRIRKCLRQLLAQQVGAGFGSASCTARWRQRWDKSFKQNWIEAEQDVSWCGGKDCPVSSQNLALPETT